MKRMKLISAFTASCCHMEWSFEWEHEALRQLLVHIRANHLALAKRLEKQARRLAKSQNGSGYYDDGKQPKGGWHTAQSTFREAWTEKALKYYLQENRA